jgi:hypothetical protein
MAVGPGEIFVSRIHGMDQVESRPTACGGLLQSGIIQKIGLCHLEMLVSRPGPGFEFGKGTAQNTDTIPGIQ